MDDDYFDYESTIDLNRKVALITGANSGLGLETSKVLAQKGATVIMACRNLKKAAKAKNEIIEDLPDAKIEIMPLDLSSRRSIEEFVPKVEKKYDTIDFLVNNAGIMMPPLDLQYEDVESQLAVNYLSHFLLTSLLFPMIENAPEGRIIQLSSIAHRWGDTRWNYYNSKSTYDKKKAYGQSKLACLMFAYELQRRLSRSRSHVKSYAAHPGASSTNLFQYVSPIQRPFIRLLERFLFQDAEDGSMPTLRALLDPYLNPGSFVGPDGFKELKGEPTVVDSSRISKDPVAALKLWEWTEKKLNTTFDLEEWNE
ncbi:SDR family NAD(P)-dependent oxidoreductase [Halosquirtibacter xylanolyticus]|uniref:oxidoreductase n=1 Tax=Halosquirtibacter xylanolyticus TaxID=3374599 RepID=UPI003747A557|nr:SDR family NAD(P)-dependent oxidoreductase [Prolixibacteraceae bacterium]